MTIKHFILILIAGLCVLPTAIAIDFEEDFESFDLTGFEEDPIDQDWYNFRDTQDLANVTQVAPILEGIQSLRVVSNETEDISNKNVQFDLEIPTQLDSTQFIIDGATITDNGIGSQQYIVLQSSFPIRRIAEFYLYCRNDTGNASLNDGCQLRVRWLEADTDGQILVDYAAIDQRFTILVEFDWDDTEFCLTVDAVDDGCFPFFELPTNFQRLSINQYRKEIPLNVTFDVWNVTNAVDGNATPVEGDAAEGIKDFATDLHFTSGTSLFLFGLVIFIAMMAGLLVAMFTHGKTNAIAPAASFFAIILTYWLIQMEFWPDWISVSFIIIVSSMVGLVLRKVMLGMQSTGSSGPGTVVGALGYFIIVATFLAMAGYQATTIQIPTGSTEETGATSQSFGETLLECIVTLYSDCSQETESALWKTITDIFGWILASVSYLYQLFTFQLPIPTVLNIIIVLPPAAALGAYAVELIRGK